MNVSIISSHRVNMDSQYCEVVERKGWGHPDTLADRLAEKISNEYSRYTISKYGMVLHHNIDKLSLLGGESQVNFGNGQIINPIRIIVNGRFTNSLGSSIIPSFEIACKVIKDFFLDEFPLIDISNNIKIFDFINTAASPGKGKFFFNPESNNDLVDLDSPKANDTACCIGYYPLSKTEEIVLNIENYLNSDAFKSQHPFIGSDIKVMGVRLHENLTLTLCVPFIAKYTPSLGFYESKKKEIYENLLNYVRALTRIKITLYINTKDDLDKNMFYLTAIGTALESGDEGQVGRGNRSNGLISTSRGMAIEAPCGKNPIYHSGKVYSALTNILSKDIYESVNLKNVVSVISQNGNDLNSPNNVLVEVDEGKEVNKMQKEKIRSIISDRLSSLSDLSMQIIQEKIFLY